MTPEHFQKREQRKTSPFLTFKWIHHRKCELRYTPADLLGEGYLQEQVTFEIFDKFTCKALLQIKEDSPRFTNPRKIKRLGCVGSIEL